MKIKRLKMLRLENLLYLYIIACPILDILSFVFRNAFETTISPSTIIRPIVAIIAAIYIFFKYKFKIKLVLVGMIYGIYAILHILVFKTLQSGSSYDGVIHELQYLVNYTFMILNLFVYIFIFKDKEDNRLKQCILISSIIYILSIYLAILTGTSSPTYQVTGLGLKGWFESGNSISAIFTLLLFILLPLIKDKKYRWLVLATVLGIGIFLTTLIGTRVGLFGFIIVIVVYVITEILVSLLNRIKIDKKIIAGGLISILVVCLVIVLVGSNTLERRKQLDEEGIKIIDKQTNEGAHITGDLMEIKDKIENGTLEEGFMNEAEQQSVIDLYNIAKEKDLSHTQMRMLQLIYNFRLVKNQSNIIYILLGNGYMNQFREMVLEMEIPAFLFNFGVIGFILYFVPFLGIFAYSCYIGIKNIKKLDVEYIMLLLGIGFTFALSMFSGYIFFNASTMMITIVMCSMIIIKIRKFNKVQDVIS